MVLMIDNYDSFTYNLVQYLGELGAELEVHRSRKIGVDALDALEPERIVISPGPCTPKEAGISNDTIKHFAGKVPILGVCLGHQCIGDVFGGEVVRADRLMHGKTSMIIHNEAELFEGLDNPFEATRYHSLIVKERPSRIALRSLLGRIRMKLWGYGIKPYRFGVCSSIQSRF